MRGYAVGACVAGVGACMAGLAWQERRPLQRTVRIVLTMLCYNDKDDLRKRFDARKTAQLKFGVLSLVIF